MAKTSKNTDLVPKEALQQLKDLDAQLDSTTNSLKEMLVPVSEISTELSKSATNYKDLIDLINKLKTAEKQATETSRKRMDIEAQKRSVQEKIAQATSAEAKELAKLRVQLQQQNQLNKSAAKEALAHANSIEAMRLQLSKLKAEWAKLDVNSDKYKQMTTEINKLNDEISKQEQSIGVWSRNVGNYSSAFNGLQVSINQVARELPSLTISASQFFLAISNNLPMLVDELKRAKDANKALREEGTKTVPVWKQLVKGIFSWQTALVVGITLLSAYGSEIVDWVKGLFKAEEALDAVAEAQKKINEASIEGAKNAAKEKAMLNLLYSTATDTNRSMEDREYAVKELQRLYPSYLENISKEEILVGKAGVAYAKIANSISIAAKNQAIYTKLQELWAKKMEAEGIRDMLYPIRESILNHEMGIDKISGLGLKVGDDEIDSWDKLEDKFFEAKNTANELGKEIQVLVNKTDVTKLENDKDKLDYDKRKAEAERLAEYLKRLAEEETAAQYKLDERKARENAEMNKLIVLNDKASYEDRKAALDRYTKHQLDSIKISKEAETNALIERTMAELKLPDTDKGREKARKKVANQILVIEQKAQSEINKIIEESEKTRMTLEEGRVKESISLLTKEYEAKKRNASVNETVEMEDLSNQYTRGIISKDDYERQKLEITRKYAEQDFAIEREYLTKVLDLTSLTDEERTKFTEQLGDAELKYKEWLYNEDVKSYEEAQKKKEEIEKEKAKVREDLLRSSFELAKALLQRDLENRLEKLDKESEANQEWRDEEAERIDRLEESGAISKEQADARKAAIDDQAEAREDEIEKKRRKVQIQQAMFEKALALMQVAIETANAVHKIQAEAAAAAAIPFIGAGLAAKALAMIPSVIASGAVQAAVIAATPIPQYAEGTEDHPGGLAIVGDGGKSEMVIANGKIFKTPSVDTLVELPRHAMVLPDFNLAAEKLPEMPRVSSVDLSRVEAISSELKASSIENGKLLKSLVRRMEINAKNEIYEREFNRLRPTKR